MQPDNISEFPSQTKPESTVVTLDTVVQSLARWRTTKTMRNEQIPDDIWKNILALEEKFPELPLHSILGITKMQFLRKRDELSSSATRARQPHVDFCEAKEDRSPCYQPARIPATNTLVVEFCRADGKIMKIHTTTDSFSELMKAFFSGA